MNKRLLIKITLVIFCTGFPVIAKAQVQLEKPDWLTRQIMSLIPESFLNKQAEHQYRQLLALEKNKKHIVSPNTKLSKEMDAIFMRLKAVVDDAGHSNAVDWDWEMTIIDIPQVNAMCLPGGKIIFYTGLKDKLNLNNDEIAFILGHEIAHALREHVRIRFAESMGLQALLLVGGYLIGLGDLGWRIAFEGVQLLSLAYGRNDEIEADLLGMELATRAGYDPRAGIRLWKKMEAYTKTLSSGEPIEFLSTHPSSANRSRTIENNIIKVLPLQKK